MFGRKRTGSVLCPSCGKLVGISDERCLNCGRRNPGMWGFTSALSRLGRDLGFVQAVYGGCVLIYLLMLAVDPQGIRFDNLFSFLGPSQTSELRFGASGALPVYVMGRWWTVLSAGWLHAGLLHIAFNLSWVRMLAPEVGNLYGPGRMVMIYTAGSIVGFGLSSTVGYVSHGVLGSIFTVGASAPILGLLGALVYYGRRTGSRAVSRQAWGWAATLIVFGFFMRGVDNFAHIGGFAGGYLASMLFDPLRPERGNHLAGALVCLILTALSILASLVVPMPIG
jgi:rhomboid protease GluP